MKQLRWELNSYISLQNIVVLTVWGLEFCLNDLQFCLQSWLFMEHLCTLFDAGDGKAELFITEGVYQFSKNLVLLGTTPEI